MKLAHVIGYSDTLPGSTSTEITGVITKCCHQIASC